MYNTNIAGWSLGNIKCFQVSCQVRFENSLIYASRYLGTRFNLVKAVNHSICKHRLGSTLSYVKLHRIEPAALQQTWA